MPTTKIDARAEAADKVIEDGTADLLAIIDELQTENHRLIADLRAVPAPGETDWRDAIPVASRLRVCNCGLFDGQIHDARVTCVAPAAAEAGNGSVQRWAVISKKTGNFCFVQPDGFVVPADLMAVPCTITWDAPAPEPQAIDVKYAKARLANLSDCESKRIALTVIAELERQALAAKGAGE